MLKPEGKERLLARFKSGSSVNDGLVIEYWLCGGVVKRYRFGNGGGDVKTVSFAPAKIDGMTRDA